MKRREFLAAMGFAVVLPEAPDPSVSPFVLNEAQAYFLRYYMEKRPIFVMKGRTPGPSTIDYGELMATYEEASRGADTPEAGYWDGQLYVRK